MIISLPAWAALTFALPHGHHDVVRRADSAIQQFAADVQGPDLGALKPAPADLPSELRSFLEKYQPLSKVASDEVGPKNEARFSSVGHCFSEFPCFSVERAAAATIGDKEEVTVEQVSAILDQLTANSSSTVNFGQSQGPNSMSGLKMSASQATLEVVAYPGTMPVRFLAGMVFDMYKMQHDDPATNSIRAVQAKTDGKKRPFVALCLYPEGADQAQAHNFCLGNNLDGSPAIPHDRMAKRFFDDILDFGCGLIDIPILCDGEKKPKTPQAPAPAPYDPYSAPYPYPGTQ